jgi:hypothetical protein
MNTTSQMLRAARNVQRSSLTSLVSEFDHFMGRFLKICSRVKPDSFFDPSETITIGELSELGSVDDVIQSRVNKTIEDKLRGSHSNCIEWVFKKFSLEDNVGAFKKQETYKEFLEVCQRRHIMAHNGGVANEEYVNKCRSAGLKPEQHLAVNDQAVISARYLKRATARVYLNGFYMAQIFLQRSFPDAQKAAYSNLLSTSHDFLERDFTKMAMRVCDFAEHSKNNFEHELSLKFAVNKALSKLHDDSLNETEQVEHATKIVESYDWSVTTPVFDLALCCLKRDFANLTTLATLASAAGLSYSDARTFVIFKEAREIDGFLECFLRAPLLIALEDGVQCSDDEHLDE